MHNKSSREVMITRKVSVKHAAANALIFLSAGVLMLGLGHYRTLIPREAGTLNYLLASGEKTSFTVDVQDQGLPKRLVQPGRISIAAPMMSLSEKGGSHRVRVTARGFENGSVNFSSRNPSFDSALGVFSSEFHPGEVINLTAGLRFSHLTAWTQPSISEGVIAFTDYSTGETLGEISVHVVNSGQSGSGAAASGSAGSSIEFGQDHSNH
ncbi:MAG: hypothetical protein LBF92_00235 [Synergistaceae bacterium]|jgi:hypothetical protein|nr:hypothetical protein [Synergistaceae bacterium]